MKKVMLSIAVLFVAGCGARKDISNGITNEPQKAGLKACSFSHTLTNNSDYSMTADTNLLLSHAREWDQ
jgi:hypothetical protein